LRLITPQSASQTYQNGLTGQSLPTAKGDCLQDLSANTVELSNCARKLGGFVEDGNRHTLAGKNNGQASVGQRLQRRQKDVGASTARISLKRKCDVWIRPAAVRAGIKKHIVWHSFRRSLATLLQANGASVKATQDIMRHASSRITLELYAQSVPEQNRAVQAGILAAPSASVPKRSLINS
jgi:hypothetical protein